MFSVLFLKNVSFIQAHDEVTFKYHTNYYFQFIKSIKVIYWMVFEKQLLKKIKIMSKKLEKNAKFYITLYYYWHIWETQTHKTRHITFITIHWIISTVAN